MAEASGISAITPGTTGTPDIGGGAGAGSSTHTPGAGSNDQGSGSGQGSGDQSSGGQGAKPSKFSFDLGDGTGPTEISFEDEGSESGPSAGDTAFKFQDLDAIKDSNPELYKSLKTELSKASRFGKFGLKSPEDYKAQSERINRLSSGKGLDGIEQTMTAMASELQGFRTGDVTNWAKEAPEEFSIAASKIVDSWGQADPQSYVGHVAKAAMYALLQKDNYGQSALDAFNAAYDLASRGTDEGSKNLVRLLDRVAHTLGNINENSKYQPDVTKVRAAQLDRQEARVFSGKVDNETDPLINQAVNKALNEGAKTLGLELDADDVPGFRQAMRDAWYEAAKQDNKFMTALKKAQDGKNLQEIASLVRANRQAFAAEALKAVYRTRLSKLKQNLKREASSKQEAGSAGAAQNGQGNAIPFTGKIDPRTGAPDVDFDFARMRDADYDMAASRHFYVKGKKEKFAY